MIKRTVVVGSQTYISQKNGQLQIAKADEEPTIPIEDIGVLILESHQSTITHSALSALMENNAVVISCDATHHPDGIMTPIAGNILHTAVLKNQLRASLPMRKQLWQQTVKVKILNQAAVIAKCGMNVEPMLRWSRKVRSGDPYNVEGRAASYYWKNMFPEEYQFTRDPDGDAPNNLLNYGYAILRAAMARSIVGSGLHPAVGLHHTNQYNAFCLADDLMEPFRPFVDIAVKNVCQANPDLGFLTPTIKKELLSVLSADTWFDGEKKPLLLALTTTTSSLVKCYAKEAKQLAFPTVYPPE